jgi:thiamine kinase-like enzyme
MIKPLSSNPGHIQYLCAQLDIGTPGRELSRVYGGLHHKMWRLETDRGTYAIKQLSADADTNDVDTLYHYNSSEAIAEAFGSRGIPAIFALQRDASYVQVIDAVGYLVHPWSNAVALPISEISEKHALEVARILARMHAIDLHFPGLKQHEFDAHSDENILLLVGMAEHFHIQLAGTLQRGLPTFLEIVDAQRSAIRILENHLVISHGDLDQKNVLWDAEGKPAMIDWESARKLNPTHEILLEALNWSGIGSHFNPALFGNILSAYQEAGGVIERHSVTAAYHCILGDWVNWLMYNVGRTLDLADAEQRATGEEQIDFALSTLQRIMDYVPDLLSVANPRATRTPGGPVIDV